MITATRAICTIEGIAPMSQSRFHDDPKLEGELMDAYDKRTWRSRLYAIDGIVHVKATAIHKSIVAAAKYSKRQIPGQGKATWTAKFAAGIALFEDISLRIKVEDVGYVDIYANADGIAGSAKRVMRRIPTIGRGWKATFEVVILDPIITKDIFTEMLETAGMFVGVGQYRPERGGTNGRWKIESVDWADAREEIQRAA